MDKLPLEVSKCMTEDLLKAFGEVQMARPPYVLRHFVVGQHDTVEQQWAQCVLELQIKYDVIRKSILGREKLQIEKAELDREAEALRGLGQPSAARKKEIDAEVKRIEVEEQDRAMQGALREFAALYDIYKSFPKDYTREDLDKAQPDYWSKRLTRQANQDVMALGRVSVGNADALRMVGMSPVPELDHVRSVEQRYLEVGDTKVLIVVPTEKKAEGGMPCLEGVATPSGVQVKYYNVYGRKVADAYNDAAMTAARDGADFMFTVEDDTFPPPDALKRLMGHCRASPGTIWGAWYPKRQEVREGAPIVVRDGRRMALEDDGGVHEVYTIPMGCTLFPVEVFLQTTHPWFATTEHLTQDSFFSQLAREAGWRLFCDTSIKCRHVDRETGRSYE